MEEIDDQAGMLAMMRQSHLSLPSHNGKPLEGCPVCQIFFINNYPEGRPMESYRMVFLDTSEDE
jgi:hypothetical protein